MVGWSEARLEWTTSAEDVAGLWVFIRPAHRRRGLGTELYDAARAHLEDIGARSLESWSSDEEGARFLVARGFKPSSHAARAPARPGRCGPVRLGRAAGRQEGRGILAGPTRSGRPSDGGAPRARRRGHRRCPRDIRRRRLPVRRLARGPSSTPALAEGSVVVLAGDFPSCPPPRRLRLGPGRQRDDRHAGGSSSARARAPGEIGHDRLGARERASQRSVRRPTAKTPPCSALTRASGTARSPSRPSTS